jgi:hypothetical protein
LGWSGSLASDNSFLADAKIFGMHAMKANSRHPHWRQGSGGSPARAQYAAAFAKLEAGDAAAMPAFAARSPAFT